MGFSTDLIFFFVKNASRLTVYHSSVDVYEKTNGKIQPRTGKVASEAVDSRMRRSVPKSLPSEVTFWAPSAAVRKCNGSFSFLFG